VVSERTRKPGVIQQLDLQVLPALSTANLRALVKAGLLLRELPKDEIHRQASRQLINCSRLKPNHFCHQAKTQTPT
jgi:hypothetical protein